MQYLPDAMTDAEFVEWASTQYLFEERERNRLAALAREALAHRETLNEVHAIDAAIRAQEETP